MSQKASTATRSVQKCTELTRMLHESFRAMSNDEETKTDLMSPEFIDQYIHDDFVCDLTGDEMRTREKNKVLHGKKGWQQLLQDEMRFEWLDYEYTILDPCPEADACDVRQTYQLISKETGKRSSKTHLDFIEWRFVDGKVKFMKKCSGDADEKACLILHTQL